MIVVRKIVVVLLVFALLFSSVLFEVDILSAEESQNPDIDISSKSAILIEASSGMVIYEKNADEQLRPASVTKIMTLLIIFEEIDKGNLALDDIVTITEHAASMGGSQCFFEAGEQQTVEDLIKCIEIASGNDAAVAMAEHIAGSEALFVDMMNKRALELGMNNTSFKNACGLEAEGHFTSARDIAIMSRELIVNHPEIKEYSTIWMDYITHKTSRGESRFDLANTNKFLKQYSGATGLKTGYTSQAKYCMSATAERNGVELIAVIMGADTKEIRNSEAGRLLDYGFSTCEIYTDTEVLPNDLCFNVKYGVKDITIYNAVEEKQISIISASPDDVKKEILPYNNLEAPIYKGDIIGVIQYSVNGEVIEEEFIYSGEDIAKKSYGYSFKDLVTRIFMVK